MIDNNNINSIKKELIVFGLRRTGNHAIINWILPQIKGDYVYYNDVWPDGPYKGNPKMRQGQNVKVDASLISFEDYNLHIFRKLFEKHKHPKVVKSIKILIVRDPFNWYASRLKSKMVSPAHYSGLNLRQLYVQYMKEFSGETALLGENLVLISYNRWKEDLEYRKSVARQLGLDFSDDGLNTVSGEGGGSSFDGMNLRGQNLQTDLRYKQYLNKTQYLSFFTNSKILEFCKKEFIFPEELKFLDKKVKYKNTDVLDNIVLGIVPKCTHILRQMYLTFNKR